MRFRWPLVRRRRLDAALAALARADESIEILSDEVRDCHGHIEALDAEIARLHSAPVVDVDPSWLGLSDEALDLIITADMAGVQAVLGGMGRDEAGDETRMNPT